MDEARGRPAERAAPAGMILAAGLGTRLAPLTDHVPKPLLPLGGSTLLDRAAAALLAAGCRDLAVNTHHLPDLVRDHVRAGPYRQAVTIFPEPQILGTAGALRNAASLLRRSPWFLLHNGDVACDADLAALAAAHRAGGALATLLLADWPAVNTVTMDAAGRVLDLGAGPGEGAAAPGTRRLTYTGVGVFAREFLDDIEPGFSSLADVLRRAIARRPGSVRALAPTGLRWCDLGTLGRFLRAAADPTWAAAAPSAAAAPPPPPGPLALQAIAGQGSDRRFWRLGAGGWTAVAMLCPPADPDLARSAAVLAFLHEAGLGAPRVLALDEAESALLMQDAGPRTLCELAPPPAAGPQAWLDAYGPVIDRLLQVQRATAQARRTCPLAVDRTLDYDQLRWETGYFVERCLRGHLGLPVAVSGPLDGEFHALAAAVARQPVVLIHRDFQSQNILPQPGGPALVDVQGMRLGPLLYDAASLLWDPYVDMPPQARPALLARYAAGLPQVLGRDLPLPQVTAMAVAAALQRLMQALGAYGYLGEVKGKRRYLAHVPRALANLDLVLQDLRARCGGDGGQEDAWLPGPMPVLTETVREATLRVRSLPPVRDAGE